ncbi:MAG: hypothetical protein ABI778_02385, partial [Ignavibacteriota bacterium]
MKYLILLLVLTPIFFTTQTAGAMIVKIDSVYSDSIYVDVGTLLPGFSSILGKPDSNFLHFDQTITNGPIIDIAFRKFKSNKLQTIKANSSILIWAKKDTAASVDSSACLITFWFDDGFDAYNTAAKPLLINKDGLNVIQVPNQDFTYAEISLAQDQFGKGATSFFID